MENQSTEDSRGRTETMHETFLKKKQKLEDRNLKKKMKGKRQKRITCRLEVRRKVTRKLKGKFLRTHVYCSLLETHFVHATNFQSIFTQFRNDGRPLLAQLPVRFDVFRTHSRKWPAHLGPAGELESPSQNDRARSWGLRTGLGRGTRAADRLESDWVAKYGEPQSSARPLFSLATHARRELSGATAAGTWIFQDRVKNFSFLSRFSGLAWTTRSWERKLTGKREDSGGFTKLITHKQRSFLASPKSAP